MNESEQSKDDHYLPWSKQINENYCEWMNEKRPLWMN